MLYNSKLSNFKEKLSIIQESRSNFLEQANLGYVLCTKTLGNLRKIIETQGLKTSEEEIYFFKSIKVEPMKYLIYYTEVRSCELRMPKAGKVQQLKYLNLQIKKVNTFFSRHAELLLYMENGHTHFDDYYFTRGHMEQTALIKSYPYYKDPLFNTSHDEIRARIKGLDLYVAYLKKKKENIEETRNKNVLKKGFGKLSWTGSYTAFVEMAYGCQAMGFFNNGNAGIIEIIEELGDFLNIDRGNPSRTYNEMKARKGSQIKFFEDTGQKLRRKMDDEDGLDK